MCFSASLALDFTVNVWDVRRPYVPSALFDTHTDATTGITWRGEDPDVLLSVDRGGTLYQSVMHEAIRPSEISNNVALSISAKGDLVTAHRDKTQSMFYARPAASSSSGSGSRSNMTGLFNVTPDTADLYGRAGQHQQRNSPVSSRMSPMVEKFK